MANNKHPLPPIPRAYRSIFIPLFPLRHAQHTHLPHPPQNPIHPCPRGRPLLRPVPPPPSVYQHSLPPRDLAALALCAWPASTEWYVPTTSACCPGALVNPTTAWCCGAGAMDEQNGSGIRDVFFWSLRQIRGCNSVVVVYST